MANALREGLYPSDWLKWEEDNLYSRKNVNASAAIVGGQLVEGTDALTIPWAGINQVTGIAFQDYAIGDAVIIAREAIVNKATIDASGSGADEAAGYAFLEGIGIVVRDGIGLSGDTIANEQPPGPAAPAA